MPCRKRGPFAMLEPPGRPLTVLLIEDHPGDAQTIRATLAAASDPTFAVEQVGRLTQGLERLRAPGIDVVLLDLMLPDSSGLDTFRQVHAQVPHIPIVVLTDSDDESLAVAIVRDGAQDYLIKGLVDGGLVARAIRDAVERKQLEDRSRLLYESLERRVAERTGELAAANEELEAFTYSVSHDLRAPLRHIAGFVRLLEEHAQNGLDPKARHYLDRIHEGAQQMGRLVDDLLLLARVGRLAPEPHPVALQKLVGDVITDLAPEYAGRRIDWRVGELPEVACDPGLMRVVFTNLLSNAVKYTRPRAQATVEIGSTMRHGSRALFVKDNGVGFDMKYADKLFGVFQRLHGAGEFEGTGVGLATVRRIIRKHGGEISADAAPDQGATFFFTLSALRSAA
jgi:signal transduction histidine kinase